MWARVARPSRPCSRCLAHTHRPLRSKYGRGFGWTAIDERPAGFQIADPGASRASPARRDHWKDAIDWLPVQEDAYLAFREEHQRLVIVRTIPPPNRSEGRVPAVPDFIGGRPVARSCGNGLPRALVKIANRIGVAPVLHVDPNCLKRFCSNRATQIEPALACKVARRNVL